MPLPHEDLEDIKEAKGRVDEKKKVGVEQALLMLAVLAVATIFVVRAIL